MSLLNEVLIRVDLLEGKEFYKETFFVSTETEGYKFWQGYPLSYPCLGLAVKVGLLGRS